ncbi:CYTH domain-containing protein [Cohaesibacter sp. ES.047]|uniref:CYTH domain-containing protein n=1 Tax=Cohaesibacter sp. ES.047 TaxID=1798205 RepID=UPI000BBFCE03|nr:CYTH domain-containing protein [Cohaesibacter sp. ES.047]SNY91267.1 CYTH domain-containing protein [Cohaesibacter sp. ES.047]
MTNDNFKTASIEIERKYLVQVLPVLDGLKATKVRQGYLTASSDSIEIRLREQDENQVMTLKSDGGLERTEVEMPISNEQFECFWPATKSARIEKVRYLGSLPSGLTFELDVFAGDLSGLRLVEVEFSSREEAESFVAPDWFGTDVTEDKRYKNKRLAEQGLPAE